MPVLNKKGFSLVEIIVAIGVFTLFAIGIYGGIQYVFKVVFNSRLRIIETGILNEQVEIIRNVSFFDVGILNGSPAGILEKTVTTTRNGIDFIITRTVRNVDDPFDGTIGGVPNDLTPADYKLVDIEIICATCGQREPVLFTTQVGPKYLEGDPNNGALFVQVFDASAQPVQGASVHIWATSTSSTIDLTDITDNDGYLRLVDLSPGFQAYHIDVSKTGFTTDQTVTSSVEVQNPVKTPASVVSQDVTSISFSIDQVSSINLDTLSDVCAPIPSVPVQLIGTKLLGTNPDVYKVNQNITTNGSGNYNFASLIWDAYGIRPTGYDLLGSIPPLPLTLSPGANQEVDLILGTNTTHSLLVSVLDSVTGQPVSDATVTVTSTGYSEIKTTGVGFIRQTDWSGGSAQEFMSDQTRYWTDDGNVETVLPAGDLKLKLVGQNYVSSGQLESSIYDLGTLVNPVNLLWEPLSQPAEAGATPVRFQIASDTTTTPFSGTYLGPDGTSATYYDPMNQVVHSSHDNHQFFRYKVFLSTDTASTTPILSDVQMTYTTLCTPPGQAYYGSLGNQSYSIQVEKTGYQTAVDSITVNGDSAMIINLVST